MKIKKAVLLSLLPVIAPYYLWQGSLPKMVLALYSSVISAKRLVVVPGVLATIIMVVYFARHGYEGTHDLKIFLVYVSFMLPGLIVKSSNAPLQIRSLDILLVAIVAIVFSMITSNFNFQFNTQFGDANRFRGYFPYFYVLLLLCFVRMRRVYYEIGFNCLIALLCYGISGTRSDFFMMLVVGAMIPVFRRNRQYFIFATLIAMVFALQLAVTVYLFSYVYGGMVYDNITVRGRSIVFAMSSVNLLGNGITPPISTLRDIYDTYFHPADIFFIGYVYELGVVAFLTKAAYCIHVYQSNLHLIGNRAYAIVALSFVVLLFTMTFDIFIVAFSVIAVHFATRYGR